MWQAGNIWECSDTDTAALPHPACLPALSNPACLPGAQVIRSLWGPDAAEEDCAGKLKVAYRRLPKGGWGGMGGVGFPQGQQQLLATVWNAS